MVGEGRWGKKGREEGEGLGCPVGEERHTGSACWERVRAGNSEPVIPRRLFRSAFEPITLDSVF